MFRIKSLLFLFSLFILGSTGQSQNCFIQLDNATGQSFTSDELAQLDTAACALREVFPTEFQNDFAVYDFGFYLHQQGYEGGMPQVFQDKIAEVEQESPYFLLFGRELSNNSGLGRIWVEVRLPNSDQYPCLVERSWSIINSVKTILQESAASDEYGLDIQKLKSAIEKLQYHVDHAINCCPLDTQGRTPLCPTCFWENEDIGVQLGYAGFIELKNISNIRVDSISTAYEEMKLRLKVDIGLPNEGVYQDFDITDELLEAKGLYGSDVSFSISKYNLDEESTCSELAELYSSQIDIQSYGNSYKYQEEILILEKAGEYRVFSRSGGNGGYTNLGERPGLNRQPVILPAIILRIVLRRAVMAASNVAVNLFMEFVMERTFGDHGADCTWLETAGYIDTNPWRLSLWALEGALGVDNVAYSALFAGAENAIVYLFQSGGNFQLDTFFLKFIQGAITGALAHTIGGAILNSKAFKRFFNKVENQTGSSIQALEFELIGLIPDFVRHPRKVKAWEALYDFPALRGNPDVLGRISDDFVNLPGFENYLRNNPSKKADWVEFDDFFVTRTDDYWTQFNNPPDVLIQTRTRALRALKEYPDEYVSALESFGLVKGDLFTRHGVDYDDEFFEIMDDFILNNTNGLSKSEVYSIFGYTTNFFYQDLNYWLREGINTSQTSGIKDLIDSGLAKLPSWNGQSQIYRGIKITGGDAQLQSILSNYQINNPITELQFTSVSASSNTAFLNHANTKIKMTITLKPDSRVRDISALSDGVFYRGFPPPELLFPSATSFHVDDIVESSNGVSTIFLTEL